MNSLLDHSSSELDDLRKVQSLSKGGLVQVDCGESIFQLALKINKQHSETSSSECKVLNYSR